MKIGLRTNDPIFAEALSVLAAEHGDLLVPLKDSDHDYLFDQILTDLDSAALRPEEFSLTVSYDPCKHPTLLRPFTEDALWRQLSLPPGEQVPFSTAIVSFDGGALYCCGKRVPLSHRETQVFSLLYHHQGQTLSPETIAKEIWGDEKATNDVHVYMRYLRKKLDEPLGRTCILTVRGEGFRLRLPGMNEGGY